jgi:hypothetical protein
MTLRGLTVVLATAAALLGTAHIGLTPLFYAAWTVEALWFVGSGLAMLAGASANFLSLGSAGRMSRSLTILIDVAMTGFFVSAWLVLPAPQVIVGGLLFAGLAVCRLIADGRAASPSLSA